MKKVLTLTLVLALCLSICALAPTSFAAGGSVLNIALDGQPEHLDVTMSSMDMASEVVFGPVFEKLVAFNGDSQVIPELAESWEVSEDNTVYTYHLRQGPSTATARLFPSWPSPGRSARTTPSTPITCARVFSSTTAKR